MRMRITVRVKGETQFTSGWVPEVSDANLGEKVQEQLIEYRASKFSSFEEYLASLPDVTKKKVK